VGSLQSRLYRLSMICAAVIVGCFLLQAQDAPKTGSEPAKTDANQKSGKTAATSQATQSSTETQQGQAEDNPLNRKRPPSKAAKIEKMGEVYKKWLDEDVRWIITDEENSAFKKLSNNAERDSFIEHFWQRRDPTPDTTENEYKEEHYRRLAYADEHFAAGIRGRNTDRGRIYIMYGKPDSIDSHPMGGPYQRPAEEGGGQTETYPFEVWRYRYIEGIGQEIEIEFVDDCSCGAYEMTMDRSKKDALLHIPNAGLTDMEAMGMANKADRFRGGIESLGQGPFNQNLNTKEFDRLETFAKLNRAPEVKTELRGELVKSTLRTNPLPLDVRVDFVKLTSDTVLVPITLQIPLRSLTWTNKEGIQRAVVSVYGELITLSGKIVQTFSDTLHKDVPPELLEKEIGNTALYWAALPMRPGLYRLNVVAKDVNGDKVGIVSKSYTVPDFSNEDKLSSSTLILADQISQVPAKEIGTGSFVIGTNRVRPRVPPTDGKTPMSFKKEERVGFWMQVYNLGVDQQTKKPSATVEYQVINTATNQPVLDLTESTAQMGNVGEQLTLAKILPPNKLDPGVYQVTIKVNDQVSKQSIAPTVKFAVQ
jgi:GWxTD domain-containing protein